MDYSPPAEVQMYGPSDSIEKVDIIVYINVECDLFNIKKACIWCCKIEIYFYLEKVEIKKNEKQEILECQKSSEIKYKIRIKRHFNEKWWG